jgi:hypothetical protein
VVKRPRIRRPSHGTVVAYLALLIALGGTAYAGSKVGSNDITRNAIHGKHVAKDTLTGKDIKEKTLKLARAWGEITPGGGVQQAHNLRASQVKHPQDGTYCVKVKARSAVATGGILPGGGTVFVTAVSRTALQDQGASPSDLGCPANTPWIFSTFQRQGDLNVAKNGYFEVVFH